MKKINFLAYFINYSNISKNLSNLKILILRNVYVLSICIEYNRLYIKYNKKFLFEKMNSILKVLTSFHVLYKVLHKNFLLIY